MGFSDSMAGKGTHAARAGSTAGSQSRDTRRIAAHGGPDDSGIGVPEFQPVDDEILGFRGMTEVPDPQFMRLCRQPHMRADEGSRGQSASGRSRSRDLTTFLMTTCSGVSNGSGAFVRARAFQANRSSMFGWRGFLTARRIR